MINNESLFLYISWLILSISIININHWKEKFQSIQKYIKDVINEIQYNKQNEMNADNLVYTKLISSRVSDYYHHKQNYYKKHEKYFLKTSSQKWKVQKTKAFHFIKHIQISNLIMNVFTRIQFTIDISHLKYIL